MYTVSSSTSPSVGSIVERFKSVRPTMFLGVPRVWEKIQSKMVASKNAAIAAGEISATAQRIRLE
jgi:long-subunit acyl-CoA synthetase (AMP-forming)